MSTVGKDIQKQINSLLSDIKSAETYLYSGQGNPDDADQSQAEIDDMYSDLYNLQARPH